MDANGVERAILMTNVRATSEAAALRFVEARPDRFALAVGGFNLLRPMKALARAPVVRRDHPVAYAMVGPELLGRRHVPAQRRGLLPALHQVLRARPPLCLNTGIPGPPIPAEAQNPIHLDRVCIRFPELQLCMIHGADPWWDTADPADDQVPQPAADDLGLVAQVPARSRCCTTCARAARTASSSRRTTRCSRWSGPSVRRRRSTCPTKCSTPGSTATPRRSSSAPMAKHLTETALRRGPPVHEGGLTDMTKTTPARDNRSARSA